MCPPADDRDVARHESMRIRLLGGFRVSVGSRSIEGDAWRLKKAASLLKLLALAPGHRLSREQMMELLWPDASESAASNSLRHTLQASGARGLAQAAVKESIERVHRAINLLELSF